MGLGLLRWVEITAAVVRAMTQKQMLLEADAATSRGTASSAPAEAAPRHVARNWAKRTDAAIRTNFSESLTERKESLR
jgi:hypothetical protein